MKPVFDQLIDVLAPIVRQRMLKHFRPDCCIATTKILREILEYYGFKSQPMAVSVHIYNARLIELMDAGPLPENEEEKMALFERTGAWGIGIGQSGSQDGCHVVLQSQGFLLDASLDQAERPERGIELPELLAVPVPPRFLGRRVKGQMIRGMVGKCMVVYKRIDNEKWRESRNWRDEHAGCDKAYGEILSLVSVEFDRRR